MYKKILSVILAGLMLVSFAGCSNKEADKSESNELVLFNAKGENAAEFEEMCKAFTEETGIPTKPFSIGSGQDSDEMLRAQMNSENPPAIYTLAALRALPEWKESAVLPFCCSYVDSVPGYYVSADQYLREGFSEKSCRINYPIHRFWNQYVCVYDDRLY